jgi:hypothetical protein
VPPDCKSGMYEAGFFSSRVVVVVTLPHLVS